MAGGMGHGSGSAAVDAGTPTPPPEGSHGGKGTSASVQGGPDRPPPAMGGQRQQSMPDWFGPLMQSLAQRQSQQQPSMGMSAPSYADMSAQALNGKSWGDLTPKAAEPAPKPAEPAAPAPSAIADLQAQLEAMRQENASHYNQFGAPYDPGAYAAGRARGGSVDTDDDIVKLALNLLRRKFQ